MTIVCSKCGYIQTADSKALLDKCPTSDCTGVLLRRPKVNSKNHGKKWSNVNRTATQVFAEKVDKACRKLKGRISPEEQDKVQKVLILDYKKKIGEEYEKQIVKIERSKPQANREDKVRAMNASVKKTFTFKNYTKEGEQREFVESIERAEQDYRAEVKFRDAPQLQAGAHRRDSIGFENTTQLASADTSDFTRPLLGGAASKDKAQLNRVVKIAVLSTHGTDNEGMCDGYNSQFDTTLKRGFWDLKYQNAMSIERTASQGITVKDWMQKTLEGRARPDIIVLLEGHVIADDCDPLVLGSDSYKRINSKLHAQLSDHLQNITGWILNGVQGIDESLLKLDIKPVTINGPFNTHVAVITHKVGTSSFYELVCHLPNDHCKIYNMSPDISKWYEGNKETIAKSLGITDSNKIINVMGDTNFNTGYDKIWSCAPSFGGDLGAETYKKAFPASSSNTNFMRQLCNGEVDWTNAHIRLHRASYLNHIPVRKGAGMKKAWGTDHPSFMSYTSIYDA